MLFNDGSFLLFLAFSILVVRLTPVSWRWVALLLLSLLFYASVRAPALLGMVALEAGVAWAIAHGMKRTEQPAARWLLCLGGALGLVGVLVLVRLMVRSTGATAWGPAKSWLVSTIGVSYFTLQAISYVVDVYLERAEAEPNPFRVLTYLVLYPKLLQGPIERASGMLRQLEAPGTPGYEALRSAAVLFGWGLFKKVVLGDRLGRVVDLVFGDPSLFGGLTAAAAAYAFAFQLYFDFSGYTDMARGTARFLGLELSENFRAPYLANGIIDFWRRWHITFSRWLLDYIFAPLQVSWRRLGLVGTALALFITFSLSGLWHGFAWTFFIWGLLHGTYLAGEVLLRGLRRGRPSGGLASRLLGVALTFHLVTFAWIFFRAPSVQVALSLLKAFLRPNSGGAVLAGVLGRQWMEVTAAICLAYALVAALRSRQLFQRLFDVGAFRWVAYTVLFVAIMLLRQDSAAYLYAQF